MAEEALIVFIKNPIEGKVKTRIAQSVGTEKALAIYKQLLDYNRELVRGCHRPCFLFFSDCLPQQGWPVQSSRVQVQGDIGTRMQAALAEILEAYERVLLIGSDCPYLRQAHLVEAWEALKSKEVVFGPAEDGGYYLIGLKEAAPAVFENIDWSTERVLEQSLHRVATLDWDYHLLESLSDIDYWEDWLHFQSSSA